MSTVPETVLIFVVLFPPFHLQWINKYDKDFMIECPPNKHVSRLESKYSKEHEDRVWNFNCRQGFVTDKCAWTVGQNFYDKALNLNCGQRGLAAGLSSWDDHFGKSKVWRIKCCEVG